MKKVLFLRLLSAFPNLPGKSYLDGFNGMALFMSHLPNSPDIRYPISAGWIGGYSQGVYDYIFECSDDLMPECSIALNKLLVHDLI